MSESKNDEMPEGYVLIRKKDGNPFAVRVDMVRYLNGDEKHGTYVALTEHDGIETLESVKEVAAKIRESQERVIKRKGAVIGAAAQVVIDTTKNLIEQTKPVIDELKKIK
jgi:hypothetical protein